MTLGRRAAARAASAVFCALIAGAAHGGPFDGLYDPAALAERQQLYPKFVLGAFQELIQPKLTPEEHRRLDHVRFTFPQSIPGWEPFGFRSGSGGIELSIASLKFINDELSAYAWLGRHGYSPNTIDDYVAMLKHWRTDARPPQPLAALDIPADARDDPDTDRLATLFIRSAYLFTVLHELGHVLHDDRPAQTLAPDAAQAQEVAADA
ncbi:MAG: hypothetical protein ABI624_21265, partial [Casimicrobiaceae bacterium]